MDVYTDHNDPLEADLEKDVDFATVLAHSIFPHLDNVVATEGCMNPYAIDFMPDDDEDNEEAGVGDLLSSELELQQLDVSGDRYEMREILWERLEGEKGLEQIIDLINHSTKNLKALVPTTKSIPCLLHSKIQIAIKILTMIFLTGIDTPETKAAQVDVCEEWVKSSIVRFSVPRAILPSDRSPPR
jgi:hypothetical protein